MFDWFYGLRASDWINLFGFFSTPVICMWFFPNLRALAAGTAITAGFWLFWSVRTGQDLSFTLASTAVVAVTCAALCSGVLFLRRLFPAKPSEPPVSTANESTPTVARSPDPLRPWIQAIAAGFAVVIVALVLWNALASPR